jgi:hypothetical protein
MAIPEAGSLISAPGLLLLLSQQRLRANLSSWIAVLHGQSAAAERECIRTSRLGEIALPKTATRVRCNQPPKTLVGRAQWPPRVVHLLIGLCRPTI